MAIQAGGGGAFVTKAVLDGQPMMGAISGIIGSLGGLTSALALTSAAVGGLITKASIDEVVAYEEEVADLAKLLGRPIAEPVAESIAELSTRMPIARRELSAIAEMAARFGIRGRENILEFTRVIGEISVATDATSSQAAEAMVKIAAIMDEPISRVRDMGNAMNELSNISATSFSEIIQSAGQLAPILQGMDVPTEDVFALAAATNEVNISVRRGARRLRSFFQSVGNTDRIAAFSRILGITKQRLEDMIDNEPIELLARVSSTMRQGGDAARALNQALTNAAGQGAATLGTNLERMFEFMKVAGKEIEGGSSLADEYAERVGTAAAKQELMTNRMNEAQREIGKRLLPRYKAMLDVINRVLDVLDEAVGRSDFEELFPAAQAKRIEDRLEQVFKQGATHAQRVNLQLKETLSLGGKIPDVLLQFVVSEDIVNAEEAVEGFSDSVFAMTLTLETAEQRLAFLDMIFAAGDRGTKVTSEWLRTVQRSLTGFGEAADNAETPTRELLKTIDSGDRVLKIYDEDVASLVDGLQSSVDELSMSELQVLRNSEAYQKATEEVQAHIMMLFRQEQALKKAAEQQERLDEMHEDESAWEAEGIERRLERGDDLIEDLRRRRIELEQGQEALEIYDIVTSDVFESDVALALQMRRGNKAIEGRKETTEELVQESFRLSEEMNRFGTQTITQGELMADLFRDLSRQFFDFVEIAVEGSESVGDAFVNMIQRIATSLAESKLQNFLMSLIGGGGGSDIGALIPSAEETVMEGIISGITPDIPRLQHGGRLRKGQLGIVGEAGPEFFIPNVDGTVVPPGKMKSGRGGGNVTVNVSHNIEVNTIDSRGMRDALKEQIPYISNETVRTIQNHESLLRQLR